ncbi:GNAT family N-acetyltransferase [Chitinophaga horti]|uniref:GNAT family N-acetyltransferase n=1 Tax=Chitinophaga horti TaxID=2920382 RepID=A0ABY6J9Y8_9BACT|nr:GNAT family N-acetyltransferase [Chitinophaga horti]UYQ94989.1 GNAT family N-acetyltransferase [Chitinophaga horti]
MSNRTFDPFPLLTTQRLTLRQLRIDDDTAIFTLRADEEVGKYLNRQPATTIHDARNFISRINENAAKGNAVHWAITLT